MSRTLDLKENSALWMSNSWAMFQGTEERMVAWFVEGRRKHTDREERAWVVEGDGGCVGGGEHERSRQQKRARG